MRERPPAAHAQGRGECPAAQVAYFLNLPLYAGPLLS
jgi:hypothetical protein